VTFTLPASGPSATFPGGARTATVVSDARGRATSPILTATAALGTWRATATHGSRGATFPMRTVAAPVVLVATVAADRTVRARRSDARAWRNLGGNVRGTPALARHPGGAVYYVAQGADGRVYARTDRLGWRRITASVCTSPGAAFEASYLHVGCRATNGHHRHLVVPVRAGAVRPAESYWIPVNVRVAFGPAVEPGGFGTTHWLVRTPSSVSGANLVFWDTRTVSTTERQCASQPSVSTPAYGSTVVACRDVDGSVRTNSFVGYPDMDVTGRTVVGHPRRRGARAGRRVHAVRAKHGQPGLDADHVGGQPRHVAAVRRERHDRASRR
jgi:hypothetical protein